MPDVTVPAPDRLVGRADRSKATVDVVIPLYNEERGVRAAVDALHRYLSSSFPLPWHITLVDNASVDSTWAIVQELAAEYPQVRVMHLDRKGRGRALRAAWTSSTADIVAYMDVDLSTGLDALLPLVAPLVTGHSDVAVGSRLLPGARTVRGPRRTFISRCYNLLLRLIFRVRFSDAQCGFKAVRSDVVRTLVPAVQDEAWFFDTELLLLAEHNGLRVHEVPVDWVDDVDSRVQIGQTVVEDLKGMVRVARAKATGRADVDVPRRPEPTPGHAGAVVASRDQRLLWQILSFSAIGVASTALHACIYLLLRQHWGPAAANLGALSISTLANTEANRRFTFGVQDRVGLRHAKALLLFALYYALTSGSVWLFDHGARQHRPAKEAVVIFATSLLATALRFVLLRAWVFRTRPVTSAPEAAPPLSPAVPVGGPSRRDH